MIKNFETPTSFRKNIIVFMLPLGNTAKLQILASKFVSLCIKIQTKMRKRVAFAGIFAPNFKKECEFLIKIRRGVQPQSVLLNTLMIVL